jgi:predicted glycosyltransferase
MSRRAKLMPRTFRIVNYAVNGVGTGHVTRLVAVSRRLRRLVESSGLRAEIYFLTSSEAGSLLFAERFPSFKLPSRTIIEEAGLEEATFLPLAKAWVLQTLELLRPDLLVVDTFPQGYFDELIPALNACPHKAFIHRAVKAEHARGEEFQRALSRYDCILVPDYAEDSAALVSEDASRQVTYTGPIIVRERDEILERERARALLGISDDSLAVYVSAGGGGDAHAEGQIHAAYEALRDLNGLHLIIGAGPLYRGRRIYDGRVTSLSQGVAAELMNAFDIAVSAAGYNSFNELMHFGVPTIFLPQQKWADDQRARASRAVNAGAALMLDPRSDAEALRRAVEQWRAPDRRAAVSEAARRLVPRNHARDAAQVLFEMLRQEIVTDSDADGVDGQE